jgi:hypothetical protein
LAEWTNSPGLQPPNQRSLLPEDLRSQNGADIEHAPDVVAHFDDEPLIHCAFHDTIADGIGERGYGWEETS